MSTEQWGLKLGQHVWFYAGDRLSRRSFLDGANWDFNVIHAWGKVATHFDTPQVVGFVVGVRTLANGRVWRTGDGDREFLPQETFRAVQVATDIRHKPVLVRIEDIHVEEP